MDAFAKPNRLLLVEGYPSIQPDSDQLVDKTRNLFLKTYQISSYAATVLSIYGWDNYYAGSSSPKKLRNSLLFFEILNQDFPALSEEVSEGERLAYADFFQSFPIHLRQLLSQLPVIVLRTKNRSIQTIFDSI